MIGIGLLIGNLSFHLFDNGLADVLGVETLRHGTNAINYVGIRVAGGDPNHGGKRDGSSKGWIFDDTRNYFYLFKDSEFSSSHFEKHFLPRMHSFLSGYNFVARIIPRDEYPSVVFKCARVFFGTVAGMITFLFVPILHFRFSRIDHERLQKDPRYMGAAYRTSQKVEAWRIGVLGTLATGVNLDWFARVKANPIKFASGVVQLTCAVALVTLAGFAAMAAPQLAVPLIVGALVA